jgi:putative ABC transport system ATP-binding protein
MDLIARLVADTGMAALVATHDPALAERADRVLRIHDGRLDG